jgi:hypothetical protein
VSRAGSVRAGDCRAGVRRASPPETLLAGHKLGLWRVHWPLREDPRAQYTERVPTVHREGPHRFFFFSADGSEPPHVHVEREARRAKFWLRPARLARSGGYGAAELLRLEGLVIEREQQFLRAWDEYFSPKE